MHHNSPSNTHNFRRLGLRHKRRSESSPQASKSGLIICRPIEALVLRYSGPLVTPLRNSRLSNSKTTLIFLTKIVIYLPSATVMRSDRTTLRTVVCCHSVIRPPASVERRRHSLSLCNNRRRCGVNIESEPDIAKERTSVAPKFA